MPGRWAAGGTPTGSGRCLPRAGHRRRGPHGHPARDHARGTQRLHCLGLAIPRLCHAGQDAPDPGAFREVSLSVIEACRRTHEVFATYTGVFLADRAPGIRCSPGGLSTLPTTLTRASSPRGSRVPPSWSGTWSSARSGPACNRAGCPKHCAPAWTGSALPTYGRVTCRTSGWTCSSRTGEELARGLSDDIAAQLAAADRDAALHWLTCPARRCRRPWRGGGAPRPGGGDRGADVL